MLEAVNVGRQLLPLLLGDGGRRKEIEASTYAYRMKYLYPGRTAPSS